MGVLLYSSECTSDKIDPFDIVKVRLYSAKAHIDFYYDFRLIYYCYPPVNQIVCATLKLLSWMGKKQVFSKSFGNIIRQKRVNL